MKNQVLNLIVSVLLGAVIASPMAFAGGVGDGGGNIQAESKMDPWKINKSILESKLAVRLAFHRFEYFAELYTKTPGSNDEMLSAYKEIYRKLFLGPKTIYQALEEAIFNPIEIGGCEALGGAEHDASVLHAPNICFSIQALSEKLYEHSGNAELVALIAHEVSHLVGTTELEASYIQTAIQSSTAASPASTIFELANSSKAKFEVDTKDIADGLESAASFARQGNDVALCMNWGFTISNLNTTQSRIYEQLTGPGISPVRPGGLWKISAAIAKVINIMNVCYAKSGFPQQAKDLSKVFGNKKRISMAEYYNEMYKTKNTSPFLLPNMPMRRLYPFDRAALRLEIADVAKLIREVQQSK